MEWEKFVCCQKEPRFEKIKNGYRCAHCGRIYWNKSVDYNGEIFLFDKLNYLTKFRGDKADHIIDGDMHILAIIHAGIVDIIYMNAAYEVESKKSIKVKKSAREVKLNFDNRFLTITDRGIIDVYDIETGHVISQFKTGRKCNCFKLNILPFGKNGDWIYIDTQKIACFSSDFKESQIILSFADIFEQEAFSVNGAMNYADNDSEYRSFAFHVMYWSLNNKKKLLTGASIFLNYQNGGFNIQQIHYEAECDMTYNFDEKLYVGIYRDEMIKVGESGKVEKIRMLPTVKEYSDGGGVFWVEEFIGYPEKIRFLSEDKIALVYTFSIIIFDIKEQKIIASYHAKLILSFFVMDSETICFSAGINTYIIHLEESVNQIKKGTA